MFSISFHPQYHENSTVSWELHSSPDASEEKEEPAAIRIACTHCGHNLPRIVYENSTVVQTHRRRKKNQQQLELHALTVGTTYLELYTLTAGTSYQLLQWLKHIFSYFTCIIKVKETMPKIGQRELEWKGRQSDLMNLWISWRHRRLPVPKKKAKKQKKKEKKQYNKWEQR